MKNFKTLVVSSLTALVCVIGAAQAATVVCPNIGSPIIGGNGGGNGGGSGGGSGGGNGGGNTPPSTDRQISVSGALVGGFCGYTEGNYEGDEFEQLGAEYTVMWKNNVGKNGFANNNFLTTITNNARTKGTWAFGTNFDPFDSFGEIFIAFHFGNGGGSPDSFIVELDPTFTSGIWELIPAGSNGISNIWFIGRGAPDASPPTPQGTVSEPGSLALGSLALISLAVAAKRRRRS